MKRTLTVLLAFLLVSGVAFAAADTMGVNGNLAIKYKSAQSNDATAGNFQLDAAQSFLTVNVNDFTAYYRIPTNALYKYYVDYKVTELSGLDLRVGMQDIPLAKYYNHTYSLTEACLAYDKDGLGIVATYVMNELAVKAGIFNNAIGLGGVSATAGTLNQTPAYALEVTYDLTDAMNMDMLEIGAGYAQDTPNNGAWAVFGQLTTMGITADLEYLAQANAGAGSTSDSYLTVGGAYQVTSALAVGASYQMLKIQSTEPKIITIGADYALTSKMALRLEGVLPTYDSWNSYSNDRYYQIAVNCML